MTQPLRRTSCFTGIPDWKKVYGMRAHRLLGLVILIFICSRQFFAGLQNEQRTLREALVANGMADLRSYFENCLDFKLALTPNGQYLRAGCHINPSAEQLFIFSKDLKLVRELYGWELLALPNGSIAYHHSQVHFAPTHSAEISVFNPATGTEKQIYPPKPYQPVRSAFIQRMNELYKQRGEAWFREHNHHMDPEQFDARVVGSVTLDVATQSIVFAVQYGDSENANDPVPFSERVRVTCAPIDSLDQLTCAERPE
jgi:hypothetical protein